MKLKVGGIYRIYRPKQSLIYSETGFDVIFKVDDEDSNGYSCTVISHNNCIKSKKLYFLHRTIDIDYTAGELYDLN